MNNTNDFYKKIYNEFFPETPSKSFSEVFDLVIKTKLQAKAHAEKAQSLQTHIDSLNSLDQEHSNQLVEKVEQLEFKTKQLQLLNNLHEELKIENQLLIDKITDQKNQLN